LRSGRTIPQTGEAIPAAGSDHAKATCGRGKDMRLLRTTLLLALPIAFSALLGMYGLGLDGSGTNFTW
jgi:hypothetical protein